MKTTSKERISSNIRSVINKKKRRSTKKEINTENSSDDDIPLNQLKTQFATGDSQNYLNLQSKQQEGYNNIIDPDKNLLKRKIEHLLNKYDQLKSRSINLDKEIKILENVNMELKYKVFM
ncbi:hypothetical protein GWI33_003887 [Rhynchophorus ferrugineus]|uniref:Uncharacterized protein n=1 Tax=Rhynchophorus ferrugineus TaxID=354439 RepID=A0A834MN14_RHYFE|nr:hypothetical protein GWI33_003887 [Rhynchophorus ferrugineus]